MTNEKLDKKLQSLLKQYPKEKYPNAYVMYRNKNDEFDVEYFYEDKKGKWKSVDGNKGYDSLNLEEDIFSFFEKEFHPFYISKEIHYRCWQNIAQEDFSDDYLSTNHHGRRLYFQYCNEHGVVDQIKQYDKDIGTANKIFAEFDKNVQIQSTKQLSSALAKRMDDSTLGAYEYLLNEPYYEDLVPLYTLQLSQSDSVSYFAYKSDGIVQYNNTDNRTADLCDWAFNYEEDFFEKLQKGCKIQYMSSEAHYSILCGVLEEQGNNRLEDIADGIKIYLNYCKYQGIYKKLPADHKKMFFKQCENFDVDINHIPLRNQKER